MSVKINQCDITMATHYDITIGNDVARMQVLKSQWVMTLLGTSIVMSQCIMTLLLCIYHGVTMHNDIAMDLFNYVFFAQLLIMILLWVVCNKNKNKFMFDQSGLENTFVVFV